MPPGERPRRPIIKKKTMEWAINLRKQRKPVGTKYNGRQVVFGDDALLTEEQKVVREAIRNAREPEYMIYALTWKHGRAWMEQIGIDLAPAAAFFGPNWIFED